MMKMNFNYSGGYPVFRYSIVRQPQITSWMNSLSPARIANRWPIAALASTCNSPAHALIPALGRLAAENSESQSTSPMFNQIVLRFHVVVFIVLFLFASAVYADVTVNVLENNDKITAGSLVLHNDINGESIAGQVISQNNSNEAKTWALHAEQWELARSGESLLSLPVLNQLINAWLLEKRKKIEVQYPGGEEGEFWVQELTDWLVSLGIPSNHMVTVPGSGADDMIKFGLIK